MRIREKLAWGAVAALALGVMASAATVAWGGPLDPPGPPASTGPIQVQIVSGTAVRSEFTSVVGDCLDGSAFGVRYAMGSVNTQLNALGADSWNLVGSPDVSVVADYSATNVLFRQCSLTYTMQRALGVGTPLATATALPTLTSTPIAIASSTPTASPTP